MTFNDHPIILWIRYLTYTMSRSHQYSTCSFLVTRTKLGTRSFRVAAPTVWNSLPTELRSTFCQPWYFQVQIEVSLLRWRLSSSSLRTFAFKTNNDIDIDIDIDMVVIFYRYSGLDLPGEGGLRGFDPGWKNRDPGWRTSPTRWAGQSPTWGRPAPQIRVESQFR